MPRRLTPRPLYPARAADRQCASRIRQPAAVARLSCAAGTLLARAETRFRYRPRASYLHLDVDIAHDLPLLAAAHGHRRPDHGVVFPEQALALAIVAEVPTANVHRFRESNFVGVAFLPQNFFERIDGERLEAGRRLAFMPLAMPLHQLRVDLVIHHAHVAAMHEAH